MSFIDDLLKPVDSSKIFDVSKDVRDKLSLSDLLRVPSMLAARATESVAGLPSNLFSLAKSLMLSPEDMGPSFLSFLDYPSKKVGEVATKFTPEYLRKNVTRKLTGEYLEPKNEVEKFLGDVAGDTSTLAIGPGGTIGKAVKASVIGNIASGITKTLGGQETAQNSAKIAGMLVSSMLNGKAVMKRLAKDAYSKESLYLKSNPKVNANTVLNNLEESFQDIAYRGLATGDPGKTYFRRILRDAKKIAKKNNGEFPIKDAIQAIKDINARTIDKNLVGVKKLLPKARNVFEKVVEEYGNKNPGFYKNYKNARDLYKAAASKSVIQSALKGKGILNKVSFPTKLILGTATAVTKPALLKYVPVAYAVGGVENFLKNVIKSPGARKIYFDLLNNGAQMSAPTIVSNVKKLDNLMNKETIEMPESFGSWLDEKKPAKKRNDSVEISPSNVQWF